MLEPGMFQPGLVISEPKLRILLGRMGKDKEPSPVAKECHAETLKKFLKRINVRPLKIGLQNWYSTTLLIQAIEREFLNGQDDEGD